jgi:hypothetical protein
MNFKALAATIGTILVPVFIIWKPDFFLPVFITLVVVIYGLWNKTL